MPDSLSLKVRTPHPLKEAYRHACALIPYTWRYGGPEYARMTRLLEASQSWTADALAEYQCRELQRLASHCYANVPYYRELFDRLGLTDRDFQRPEDLQKLPFLDKEQVVRNFDSLTASNVPRRRLLYQTTGGTSGKPLTLYVDRRDTLQRDRAFWDTFTARVGRRPGSWVASLRNDVLPGTAKWDSNVRTRILRLDPFKLTPQTVSDYVDVINRSGIPYLHTYPSAAATLLTLARGRRDLRDSPLRWILATSENVYPGQRAFLEAGFNCRFFSMYGHTERLVFAGECEHSSDYHVYPEYGIVELIDEAGAVITQPGVRGEIAGTGFINDAMPLLRYRTGDYAEYGNGKPCACARAYPRLVNVVGRWLQEMIVRPDGAFVSVTALNMHSGVFDRVDQFQFYQEDPGEVELRLVPAAGYSPQDERAIRRSLSEKLGPAIELRICPVDSIPRTAMGKHRFLIQKLPVNGSPESPR